MISDVVSAIVGAIERRVIDEDSTAAAHFIYGERAGANFYPHDVGEFGLRPLRRPAGWLVRRALMGTMRNAWYFLTWIAAATLCAGVSTSAQWLHEPTAGAPRTRDGKVDMTGRVPRLNGKPDLSGLWQVQGDPRAPGALFGLGESLN